MRAMRGYKTFFIIVFLIWVLIAVYLRRFPATRVLLKGTYIIVPQNISGVA
jgi:hypothetical protein